MARSRLLGRSRPVKSSLVVVVGAAFMAAFMATVMATATAPATAPATVLLHGTTVSAPAAGIHTGRIRAPPFYRSGGLDGSAPGESGGGVASSYRTAQKKARITGREEKDERDERRRCEIEIGVLKAALEEGRTREELAEQLRRESEEKNAEVSQMLKEAYARQGRDIGEGWDGIKDGVKHLITVWEGVLKLASLP